MKATRPAPLAKGSRKHTNGRRQQKVKNMRADIDNKAMSGQLSDKDLSEFKLLVVHKGKVVTSTSWDASEIAHYAAKPGTQRVFKKFLCATKEEANKKIPPSMNCHLTIESKTGRLLDASSVWFAPGTRMEILSVEEIPDGQIDVRSHYRDGRLSSREIFTPDTVVE